MLTTGVKTGKRGTGYVSESDPCQRLQVAIASGHFRNPYPP